MLRVHSIESFGTHEGPGIRFVVFLQWCLFKCIYCHNPDTIALSWWEEMTDDKIVAMTKQVKPYFGKKWWFTVSWWEPLFQAKWLIPLFQKLRCEGINIAVDTNGFIWNEDVEKLIDLTDLFLVDVKHFDPKWHKKITTQDNKSVFKFIHTLEQKGKAMRIRYVLVPWYTDQEEYIKELWKKLGHYTCIERLEILPYHRLGEYKREELGRKYELAWVAQPSNQKVQDIKLLFEKYFKKVLIR